MNKKLIIVSIAIALVILGALTYVLVKNNGTPVTPEQPSGQEKPQQQQPANDTNTRSGTYIAYSEDAVAKTAGTKLLFFHAPWCPQCRDIEQSITTGGIPSGVTVLKVDYDSNQRLRQKYGVTLQTTFVRVDDSGNKEASYVAYEEPQFSSVERNLLP